MCINAPTGCYYCATIVYVHTYAWGILECRPRYIYIYIYIFKISMSHDLRVSSLAAIMSVYVILATVPLVIQPIRGVTVTPHMTIIGNQELRGAENACNVAMVI